VPFDTTKCLRAAWLYGEAIIIDRNRIFEQSVESGSRRRFLSLKVEARMMPRTPDGCTDDNTLV
jgi:hypothetical protein